MTDININYISDIRKMVKSVLDPMRFEHTLGVSYTAACLGMVWGVDPLKCELAGLLHDCAKCYSHEEQIRGCNDNLIALTDEELLAPQIIHAKYGSFLAETVYGVDDQDILNAIKYHTTGRAQMSMLEKIIYVSDFIEPMRDKSKCLKEARQEAFRDLDRCMVIILLDTFEYLEQTGKPVDSNSFEAYNYLKAII